jgi:aspartyl-tRNA(Asn)/glutamyl-tRNA(Gln) amidotransferase subunit A
MPDLAGDVRGLRIGLPREAFAEGLDPEVRTAVMDAAQSLRGQGATLVDVTLPSITYALPTYYLIATSEASANLARYDGVQYGLRLGGTDLYEMYTQTRGQGFGPEVKRRIMLGTYALSAGFYEGFFLKAQRVRTLIRRDFEAAFAAADVLLMPTSPTTAFRLGEKTDEPLQMYLADVYTIPVNLAGLPAVSIPCGFAGGLPIGLQVIGRPFDEAVILRAAQAYERTAEWYLRRPPVGDR